MKTALLVYPHQLFEDIAPLKKTGRVFLIEEPLLFGEFPFHKQKLVLHRASMKGYEKYLEDHEIAVTYIEHHAMKKTGDIAAFLKKAKVNAAEAYDPTDDWLATRLKKSLAKAGIPLTIHDSRMFLTTVDEFSGFFDGRTGSRKYFMNDFYVWQRKRLDILVKGEKPVGGAWSFDADNRKKLPKGLAVPEAFAPNRSELVLEAVAYVEKYFPKNFGATDEFWCPVTHADAKKHLRTFFKERFASFGPYEDAMTEGSPSVFHSTISPLLNNGLLTPQFVIDEALQFAAKHDVPLSSLEGFVRQIIGWREYMRAMYVLEGKNIRTKNYFKATRRLPRSFWWATTGLDPVDHHVRLLEKYAYTHHIPRLMVLGNCMNLCGIRPDDVYAWFMEMHIDAYDWVMVPNVYSMALYADGGTLTTKPYIASSNYILKMSDFAKGAWCETFDALFWNFVDKHYKLLQKEGRLGFIGVQFAKMPDDKKQLHRRAAKRFLGSLDGPGPTSAN